MPPRVPAIDRLRAAALVLMLVHHFTKWLGGDPGAIVPGWDGFVVTDLAAPAFAIAAGASALLFVDARLARGARPANLALVVVRRYGLLIPMGMLLQWLFTSHVPFDWGVLQALGAGVVASTLLTMLVRSPVWASTLAVAALVAGPMIEHAVDGRPDRLADILGGTFPVVTYLGFALVGAAGARFLARNPERGRDALVLGLVFAAATALLVLTGRDPDRYPGGVTFVVPGLAGTFLIYGVLDTWRALPRAADGLLRRAGTHSLGIFITHYVVSWGITRYGFRNAFSPRAALLIAVVSTTLFTLIAPRVPALPWSLRTGWNHAARSGGGSSPQKRLASSAA